MKQFKKIAILLFVGAALAFAGCANPASSGSPSRSFSDTQPEMTAYSNGLLASLGGSTPTASFSVSGAVVTYHFDDYLYGQITVNGSVTVDTGNSSTNGTLTFSGGAVSTIVYNNIIISPPSSGTLVITFNDGSSWTYNYANSSFTSL